MSISMVDKSPKDRVVPGFPLPNGLFFFMANINGGDPNHLHPLG